VRADLTPGQQAVQAGHALTEWVLDYPTLSGEWHAKSNYLAYLVVSDEQALKKLMEMAIRKGIETSTFREPDLDNTMTAITLGPGEQSRKLCRGLSLALRGP